MEHVGKVDDFMYCSIQRSLGVLGERWTLLILRDALYGMTRFDEWERSLGIAPNVLTVRLKALVEDGLLERRRYSEHPPRYAYVPTARGRRTSIFIIETASRSLAI